MTNAERIARWRKRHANNLARKAAALHVGQANTIYH